MTFAGRGSDVVEIGSLTTCHCEVVAPRVRNVFEDGSYPVLMFSESAWQVSLSHSGNLTHIVSEQQSLIPVAGSVQQSSSRSPTTVPGVAAEPLIATFCVPEPEINTTEGTTFKPDAGEITVILPCWGTWQGIVEASEKA